MNNIKQSRSPFSLLKRVGLDWFVFALLGMIGLAYIFPAPGIAEGPFSMSSIAEYGVILIFFFYGLKQDTQKVLSGLSNWKLHLVIQLSTFLIFPLIVLTFLNFQEDIKGEFEYLWLGIFFLAALPSTVSSSVVMVSIANGNIPAAIFNASISGIIGIFLTPLWMEQVIDSANIDLDLQSVLGKLILKTFLPVVAGIFLNVKFKFNLSKYKSSLKYFDQSVILMIVYTSFCKSFSQNMFSGYQITDLLLLGIGLLGLFLLMIFLMSQLGKLLNFNREDKVTMLFCGSKKSLVHGSVIVKVMFASSIAGVVLLPVMIYHSIQLILASVLAQSIANNKKHTIVG
ncbi:bile acid:sodium symporter family protein [Chondrinema litorale]|uniref:bile acid:sodium symporter family protein n=1 Tax=Chondrinema litorale TaxID=2994555 RepID=UPI002543EFB8|nr:bile acid:sodium symporter family protein [Chondrinema litorale]UZR97751.1 bile acid:sodium symporter [Chondrinema litorale]